MSEFRSCVKVEVAALGYLTLHHSDITSMISALGRACRDESHFNISFIAKGKVTRHAVSTPSEEKGEPKKREIRTDVASKASLLGQAGSRCNQRHYTTVGSLL